MLEYRAPEQDIEFLLFDLFKVHERWAEIPALADVSEELAREAFALAAAKIPVTTTFVKRSVM